MPEKVEYLPFHAINEFMRDDYRLAVITEVLSNQDKIAAEKRAILGKLIAKFVIVQGFRNSNLAPVGRKAKSSTTLFEHSAEFVALIIDSWRELHLPLAGAVFAELSAREWENLQPLEGDRLQLPGFLIHWPIKDNFEVLIKAVKERAPELVESDDNISLMVVWLGNRLPYDLYAQDENGEGN
ncbi:MAG: hypothetical protein AB9897_07325 [Anaerolineaceae bacterium]